MNLKHWILLGLVVVSTLIIGQAVTAPGMLTIVQEPLFARAALPPLNMLVMGKDHKIYYEAYNDASDLNGDGSLDITYKPTVIDYYGYFNSNVCYTWSTDRFVPQTHTADKTCSGAWSGDFLNYLTTSRMDALRRVLYGGFRKIDTATETVLEGAYIPQDGHTWGKEYQSIARDGYDISQYSPLSAPAAGKYHLFAVVSVEANTVPLFRVLESSSYRVWNWLSIESPVAGINCTTAANVRVSCTGASGTQAFPGHPANRVGFDSIESTYAVTANRFGGNNPSQIDCNGTDCNPFGSDDNYLSVFDGQINIRNSRGGTYQFRIDGDDSIDFALRATDGTLIASAGCYGGRGFGACAGGEASAAVTLSANTSYNFKFRQEEATGGDGYQLQWRKTSGGNNFDWRDITTSRSDADNNGNLTNATTFTTYNLTPTLPGATLTDYKVRVTTCPANTALQDSSCKAYPDGNFKPTGILHDYGEAERMYFGLITGSQRNNLEGGVLRSNISNFKSEINANTGQFLLAVKGIVHNLDALRVIGGGYNGGTTNNLTTDAQWNWNNGTGNCPSPDPSRALANGECRMWGNPIAEMMYESLRYFAGAKAPTDRFATTGGSSVGDTEENTMGLTKDTWKDPYGTGNDGLGYPTCAKPFQTVISDINPSYDGDLPNSAFSGAVTTTSTTPANINGFNPATQGSAIWNHEFGGPRNVFIGEVAGVTDGAPTAKSASSFGNIRGLSPEEPTKGGTYYAASVARFGRITEINAASKQSLRTYSIALASPLPKIEFPVGGRTVTLMPFAKTVSGTFGGGARKPTNTIVDFYVEKIVNVAGQPTTIDNGGRPYAVFRINYEDVEQGNDHDMDAIVRYEVMTNADNTLNVNLTSEYAAGSANQNMGYVISGTTRDGVYLEVRDTDSAADQSLYMLNTPPGAWAGDCLAGNTTAPCNQYLGFTASRKFTPATAGATTATQLKDPLWYAAKYGGFDDANNNGLPDTTEWDADADGVPDNYFLVTNPLNLRSQLTKAFDAIQKQNGPSGTISIAGARVDSSSLAMVPSYNSYAGGHDWTGELSAYNIANTGVLTTVKWNASTGLATKTPASRNILTAISNVTSTNRATAVQAFQAANLGATTADQFGKLGYNVSQVTNAFGAVTPNDMVGYLRGDRGKEGTVKPTAPFRKRTSILGDIINSTPAIATNRANYGWAAATGLSATQRTAYSTYVTGKSSRNEHVFVGANDGMLHAFDDAGNESFAYIPNGVLGKLAYLADPVYTHNYYVDGNLTLSDVLINSNWETVLVGAAGAGGRSVFGLNVSDAGGFAADDVLWEVNSQTDADMGYVLGKPVIVPTDNGRWVAIFGNGYNSVNGDPVLFIVDVATGVVIRKLAPADGDNVNPNGLGNVSALDSDGDGLADTVYGGDLLGNVWKFDIGGTAESSWSVALAGLPLFVAKDAGGVRQPITGAFDVSVGPGAGYMLYFGTGSYFKAGDNSSTAGQQTQTLYGIWDNGTALTTSRNGLVGQQITAASGTTPSTRSVTRNPVNYLTQRGWYLDLVVGTAAATGEKFIAAPRIQSGKILFPTYEPGVGTDCVPGGKNWLYALDPLSGGASFGQVTIPPGGTVGGGDTGGISTGEGAPSRGVGITQPQPLTPVYCDPSNPACVPPTTPPPTGCSEVIIDPSDPTKPLVVQRACGRQSWRQLL